MSSGSSPEAGGFRRAPAVVALLAAAALPVQAPAAPGLATGEGAARVCRNCVLVADTVWSGAVLVEGQATVKRGATLRIEPGTTVRFAWADDNRDGIGDAELRIEGRLVARGTAERMITFTSAREQPAPKDWTFVILNLSRGSVVENCLFEYAFTGIQLHFSSGVVRESVFRRNFEALRFSTADVTIEHNDFVENGYGIRYEARGSATTVTGNRLAGNEYGFFPVTRGAGGGVRIAGNCVESLTYNVKVGEEQREDLDYRENWWGSADPARIEETFFDRRRDPSLGTVLYAPFRGEPVADCGRGGANR